MNPREKREFDALMAARDYGIETILFRNSIAKKLGLNLTESLCLTLLALRSRSTPTELARAIGLTTGAMTTLLDRLETRGLIQRSPNPADRRGVIVEPDPRYTATSQQMVAGIQRANAGTLASFAEEELAVVARFLSAFAGNLQREGAALDAG